MHERLAGASEPEQERLKCQPLAGEAVQRGQTGDRHRADEKTQAGPRHPPQQAPKLLDLPRPGRHDDAPRAEKQETFEHRMVQYVIQTGRQPDRGDIVPAVREPHHPCAKAQENDPDILNAVVREESF